VGSHGHFRWSLLYKIDGVTVNTHKYFPGPMKNGDRGVQMPTSSYITAFQGVRAIWGWLRKKNRTQEEQTPRERALEQADIQREVDLVRAEGEREVAKVRAEIQAARLEPVMAMFATVQANKRARIAAFQGPAVDTVSGMTD
jgi:hypothetical protein